MKNERKILIPGKHGAMLHASCILLSEAGTHFPLPGLPDKQRRSLVRTPSPHEAEHGDQLPHSPHDGGAGK